MQYARNNYFVIISDVIRFTFNLKNFVIFRNCNEMNQYKIYKIINFTTNEPVYIGCTRQSLNKRLYQHYTDSNSMVFKTYFAPTSKNHIQIIIKEFNMQYKTKNGFSNDFDRQIGLHYEEILTYIYGFNHDLCNYNAGNFLYHNMDDIHIFQMVHSLLFDLINGIVTFEISELFEILTCIKQILFISEDIKDIVYGIHQTKYIELLQKMDNLCCEELCDL